MTSLHVSERMVWGIHTWTAFFFFGLSGRLLKAPSEISPLQELGGCRFFSFFPCSPFQGAFQGAFQATRTNTIPGG